jgi:L-lactate dehydrogenase
MAERRKVSVVGAGSVGATVAYTTLIRGAAKTMALYDIAVTADSDVVVITAGGEAEARADAT